MRNPIPWEGNPDNIGECILSRVVRKRIEDLIGLFPVTALLELDLARLLDQTTNVAAAGGEEVINPTAGDVVAGTSFPSLHCLCDG